MFKDLVNDMQDEIELQFIKLDQFTSSSFDWLDQLMTDLQLNIPSEKIDDNEPQEITLDTQIQNESAILPSKSESYKTLESQMNEFDSILSNDDEYRSDDEGHTNSLAKNSKHLHQSKENIPNNTQTIASSKQKTKNIPEVELEPMSRLNDLSKNNGHGAFMNNFEISDFVSELAISAQRFRAQWKESITKTNKK